MTTQAEPVHPIHESTDYASSPKKPILKSNTFTDLRPKSAHGRNDGMAQSAGVRYEDQQNTD
jgi:hypothetical protein